MEVLSSCILSNSQQEATPQVIEKSFATLKSMQKLFFGSLDLWSQKTVFLMCLCFKLIVLSLTENNMIFIFQLWSPL